MASRTVCVTAAAALLAACGGTDDDAGVSATPGTPSPAPISAAAPPPPTAARHVKNWFDLAVGDCVTTVPAVDIGEVSVTVVDCGSPHRAEVYLRKPTAVNTAIADVANATCASGLADYAGTGPFAPIYLIDSTQDRTSDNPLPSTIICLLEATGGGLLTTSARTR